MYILKLSVSHHSEDGGRLLVRNVCQCLLESALQHSASYTSLCTILKRNNIKSSQYFLQLTL